MKNHLNFSRSPGFWFTACLLSTLLFLGRSSVAQLSGNISLVSMDLAEPTSVAIDSSGNIWIADSNAGTLLENGSSVNPGGTLQWPYQVAADGSGNVYVYDAENFAIYEVSGDSISELGDDLEPGLAVDSAGDVIGVDEDEETVEVYTASYSDFSGGTVSGGILSLAVDNSGNLFIGGYCEVVGPGGVVAGTGTCGDGGSDALATDTKIGGTSPNGLQLAVDSSDNLFISDLFSNKVREVLASTGYIYTVVGTGSPGDGDNCTGEAATSADIQPFGVGLDSSGDLYVTDAEHNVLCKVN